jgi:glutamate/tyrosine decarboxylase-like PLP-dependent enzyme
VVVEDAGVLRVAHEAAARFLAGGAERPVAPRGDAAALAERLGRGMPEQGEDAETVVRGLVAGLDPALVASTGPRYFGFVTGGALPAAIAAEWLASAWDQNTGLHVMSPALAAVEDAAARWTLDALDLPRRASVGFVTGATAANLVGLAAGRHRLLSDAGWDVEADGLQAAPPIGLVCGAEVHAALLNAAQFLGLGTATWRRVAVDDQGRMRAEDLTRVLDACDGPTIVAAQAGNVNSGSFDPLAPIAAACRERGAWLHVDGAFGLWVRASEELRQLADGAERADSWAVDAHKWLNVPYDSGIALVADADAHRAAMSGSAPYLITGGGRDGMAWTPEASRRGRGLAVYAALRQLGRRGLAELVERCCRLARRCAAALEAEPGISVANDVVINQVVVTFAPPPGADPTAFRDRIAAAVQADGTCWLGGTVWQGQPALRLSVSNWRTTEDDVDRSAAAIAAAYRSCTARAPAP